jgi:hypothetical protein
MTFLIDFFPESKLDVDNSQSSDDVLTELKAYSGQYHGDTD